MDRPIRRRVSWLVGLALGVLAALLIAPMSRWLVREQILAQLPPLSFFGRLMPDLGIRQDLGGADPASVARRRRETAERYPNDYQLQLAVASTQTDPNGKWSMMTAAESIRGLKDRFGDRPSLYANAMRFATGGGVSGCHRDEEILLSGDKPSVPSKPIDADLLAAFDQDAAEGERLDPDNAYFPLLRSAGLFAAHRDSEAVEALDRAGEKSRWEEYYLDEVQGKDRLALLAFDDHGVISRMARSAAVLFPHFAAMRSAARMAAWMAVQAEQHGRPEEGLRIRLAVMRCGALMRAHSRTLIGNLVGIAVTRIATVRPGGGPPEKFQYPGPGGEAKERARDAWNRQQLDKFYAYIAGIGHPDDARWMKAEIETGVHARDLIKRGAARSVFDLTELRPLIYWWLAGLLTLSNAFWLVALGGLAGLAVRSRRIRAGQPLPVYARWGIFAGASFYFLALTLVLSDALSSLYIPALLGLTVTLAFLVTKRFGLPAGTVSVGAALYVILGDIMQPSAACTVLGVAVLAFLIPNARRIQWRGFAGGFGTAVLTAATLGAMSALVAYQTNGPRSMIYVIGQLFSDSGEGGTGSSVEGISGLASATIVGMVAVAVPLLLAFGLSVASRVCRVPLSAGIVRGFRGMAVPAACVLLLIYGGMVIPTLREEAKVGYHLDRTMDSEGRYLAEVLGEQWPGLVR